jgi:hypothetical protein
MKRAAIPFLNYLPAHLVCLLFHQAFVVIITLHDFPAWPLRSMQHDVVPPILTFADETSPRDE